MEILSVEFEGSISLKLKSGEVVTITPFKERDPSHIKVGIDAPRSVRVNREEVQAELKK